MTRDRSETMWFCADCRSWNGWKLDSCLACERDRPRFPLRTVDVDVDHADRVRRRDRVRGALRSLRDRLDLDDVFGAVNGDQEGSP